MLRRLGNVFGLLGLGVAGLFALAAINESHDAFGLWVMAGISALIGVALWYVLAGD
jgi:uncharacterized membrane protein YeiH